MKKIAIIFFAALIICTFISCATTSRKLGQMQTICEKIEKNDDITKDDFERMATRFSEISQQLESRNLNDEEKDELDKLKGRFYGAVAAKATKSFKNIYDGLGNVFKGFLEGLNNSFNQ